MAFNTISANGTTTTHADVLEQINDNFALAVEKEAGKSLAPDEDLTKLAALGENTESRLAVIESRVEKYRGQFANLVAAEAAIADPQAGWTFANDDTNTIWRYDDDPAGWVDTGNAITAETGESIVAKIAEVEGVSLLTNEEKDKLSYLTSIDVRYFGAKGDTVQLESVASITSGTANLTITGANFTQADVGKSIIVHGASTGGVKLLTTILSVQSSTQCTLSASATASVSNRNVSWGTDDTAAIQAGINYLAALPNRSGRLTFPAKTFWIGGALQTSIGNTNPNCQIYVPAIRRDGEIHSCIDLVGEHSLTHYWGILFSERIKTEGTIWYSPITGTGTRPALLGGRADDDIVTPGFTRVTLRVENIRFRTHFNLGTGSKGSSLWGINADKIYAAELYGCEFDVDVRLKDTVEPTITNVGGVLMPGNSNGARSRIESCSARGQYIGFGLQEHTVANGITAGGCVAGAVVCYATHPIYVGRFLSQWNKYDVVAAQANFLNDIWPYTSANFHPRLQIQQLVSERWKVGGSLGTWWGANVYTIHDPNNILQGNGRHVVSESETADRLTIIKNGGTKYTTTDVYTTTATVLFSDTFPDANGIQINTRAPQIGTSWTYGTGSPSWPCNGSGSVVSGANGTAIANSLQANVRLRVGTGTLTGTAMIMLRRADGNNYAGLVLTGSGTMLYREVVGGVTTDSTIVSSVSVSNQTWIIELNGSAVSITNGTTSRNYTMNAALLSNTLYALNASAAGEQFTLFEVETLT